MKVLLTRPFFKEDVEYIKTRIHSGIELIIPSDYNEPTLIELAAEAEVLMGAFVSDKLLQAASNLKFIQIPWTGVDVLDYELLQRYGVTVCNSHSNALSVAEHAVALMMDAAKKVAYHDRLMRIGKWNRISASELNEITPFSTKISGSTVAIIGYGAIGNCIASLLSGFKCKIKAFKRNVQTESYSSDVAIFHNYQLLQELYDCDFVFVAVPLTEETRNMVNSEFFRAMNPHSVLINISRGEVVSEDALYTALSERQIDFAAIDTWFNYPKKDLPICFPSAKHPFHELNNLVLSPHRAGYLQGSLPHLDDAISNLNRCAAGEPLINVISLKNKY